MNKSTGEIANVSRFPFGRVGDLFKQTRNLLCPQMPLRGTFVAPLNSGRACLGSIVILALSGCASTQTAVPVRVQVSVPCITQDQLPAKPQISADADLLKLSDGDLILTIAGERIALKSYAGEMDALIQACLKP